MVLSILAKIFGAAKKGQITGYTRAREVSGNRYYNLSGFESFIVDEPKQYNEKNPRGHTVEGTELRFLGPDGKSYPLRFAKTYDIVSPGDHVAIVLANMNKMGALPVLLANKTRDKTHFIETHIGQVSTITLLDKSEYVMEHDKFKELLNTEAKEFAKRGLGVSFK